MAKIIYLLDGPFLEEKGGEVYARYILERKNRKHIKQKNKTQKHSS